MDLEFIQVEQYLLNAYWNYDSYNTEEYKYKDNWNLENFLLLGPNRITRHIDIVARVDPRYSSGEPVLVFFDLRTKYAGVILKSPIVEAPTIIYIPRSQAGTTSLNCDRYISLIL